MSSSCRFLAKVGEQNDFNRLQCSQEKGMPLATCTALVSLHFSELHTKSELHCTTNTLLCLELICTEYNFSCDDSTIRTQLGESVSNFNFFAFGSCFPPISKPHFGQIFGFHAFEYVYPQPLGHRPVPRDVHFDGFS